MTLYARLVLALVVVIGSVIPFHSNSGISTTLAMSKDIVKLSEEWWGVSIGRFPAISGLTYGDYSEGDHPTRRGYKVILPFAKRIENKWLPKELRPFEFDFTDEKGLVEISGFYKGKQEEVVARLTDRYGKPSRELRAIGLVTYVWDFDRTSLDVTSVFFSLHPRSATAIIGSKDNLQKITSLGRSHNSTGYRASVPVVQRIVVKVPM
jgi:hypothetical protein